MDAFFDHAYAASLATALWASGLALGLSHSPSALVAPLRRWPLLVRVLAVNAVAVPLLVWGLLHALVVPDEYAVGLLLVGMTAAGPLGMKAAQLARADVPLAVALVVGLELVNLVSIPLWAALLLPDGTRPGSSDVLRTLLVLVLAPLVAGAAARRLRPTLSAVAARPLTLLSDVALAAAVALVLARDGDEIVAAAAARAPLVAALSVLAAMALGYAAGAPRRDSRVGAALVSGVRANGPALAIVATSFPGQPDVRAGAIVFALFSVLLPVATAVVAARREPAPQHAAV